MHGAPDVSSTIAVSPALFSGGEAGDLVSLADVKLELGITATTDDAWLLKIITRSSKAVESWCNRRFALSTVQDIFLRSDYADHSHNSELLLSGWPFASYPNSAGIAPPIAPAAQSGLNFGTVPSPFDAGFSSDFAHAAPAPSTAVAYLRASYVTEQGETPASLETFIIMSSATELVVSSPAADVQGLAIGWNLYAGISRNSETLQNSSPMAIGTSWSIPPGGLVLGGNSPPNSVLLVANYVCQPLPLCEGVNFVVDPNSGRILRTGHRNDWRGPMLALYQSGFSSIPDDVQDAVVRVVKARWFGRQRDPMIRQQAAPGIIEQTYFFSSGPGSENGLSPDVVGLLRPYRVPVVA